MKRTIKCAGKDFQEKSSKTTGESIPSEFLKALLNTKNGQRRQLLRISNRHERALKRGNLYWLASARTVLIDMALKPLAF